MSIFSKAWQWLKKELKFIERDGAKIAITVTEHVKEGLQSGVIGFLATLADNLLKSHVAEDVVAAINKNIDKVIALELALQGLPDNPTAQQLSDFEQQIIGAFGKLDNKSKLYSTIAAQVALIVDKLYPNADAPNPTWAEIIAAVQEAFLDYEADKQQFPTDQP